MRRLARGRDASDFYEWLAPIYDDLYEAIDVQEAVRQWRVLIRKVARIRGSVPKLLDLGCGTGRYLTEWASAGFEVTGVDASAAMVAIARRRLKDRPANAPPNVVRGNLRLQLPALRARGPFDLVVAHFNFFNLFPLRDVTKILAHLRPAMAARGCLLADCAPPGLASSEGRESLGLAGGDTLRVTTLKGPRRGTITRSYCRRGSTRTETYYPHTSRDLRRAARAAGWRVEHVVEWRPDRILAPWSFVRPASDRHRVYVLRPTVPAPLLGSAQF